MCYHRLNKGSEKLRTANEDIRVWKVLTSDLKSIVRDHQYDLNRTYRSQRNWLNLILATVLNRTKVDHGFHSYTTLNIAKLDRTCRDRQLIVACTVPKGALYYRSEEFCEIVSSSIRVDGIRQEDGSVSDHNPLAPPVHLIEFMEE